MKSVALLLLIAAAASAFGWTNFYNDEDVVWTEEMVTKLMASVSTDAVPTTLEMINGNGYTADSHQVTTEDGYILTMHRISASPVSPAADGKPVVILMHGLLASSTDWIVMGPGKGFGYILADAGFDVWMGNARGNSHSKNHTTITDLSSYEFWNFSWHQIGYYDLPAMIDYALKTTGLQKVFYMGHSQGTTSFFVMASQRTEYNDKIKAMFALSPVVYMGNLISPLFKLATISVDTLSTFFDMFGLYEFVPKNDLISKAGSTFCNDDALTQFLCTNSLFLLCGFNKAQLNTTMLPRIVQYTPAGASTRQLIHYSQGIKSGKFRQYNHGWIKNMVEYGSLSPPDYDLSLVTAPVHLIYSDNDWISAVKDVAQLFSELGNPVELRRVLDGKWNHIDYEYGIDAKTLVYDDIIATIQKSYSD